MSATIVRIIAGALALAHAAVAARAEEPPEERRFTSNAWRR